MVDMSKAYDMVEWSYLIQALKLSGPPHGFVDLIQACVCTSRIGVSVNRLIDSSTPREACAKGALCPLICLSFAWRSYLPYSMKQRIKGVSRLKLPNKSLTYSSTGRAKWSTIQSVPFYLL